VGFMVDKVALSGFLRLRRFLLLSFYQLLLSQLSSASLAGTTGPIVADIRTGLSHPSLRMKKKTDVLNLAPRYEEAWESGGIAARILQLGECPASPPSRLPRRKTFPVPIPQLDK
jgi:hypothetical protein